MVVLRLQNADEIYCKWFIVTNGSYLFHCFIPPLTSMEVLSVDRGYSFGSDHDGIG